MKKSRLPATVGSVEDALIGWGLISPLGHEETYALYLHWKASNYLVLPFAGAFLDQPYFIRHDYGVYSLLDTWLDMDARSVEEAKQMFRDVQDGE